MAKSVTIRKAPFRPLKLFGELVKLHQLLKTLVHGQAQVLADEGDVDVFLISLNYSINARTTFDFGVRRVHLSGANTITQAVR